MPNRNPFNPPNNYGNCGGCDGSTATPITLIPKRVPDCEPQLECVDGVTKVPCHCLYTKFLAQFPQYKCKGEDAICCALKQAECMACGILDACKKEMATMFMAGHLFETNSVAITENASRMAAVSSGALGRPSGGASWDAWLSLSPWGVAYAAMVEINPRIGVLGVG